MNPTLSGIAAIIMFSFGTLFFAIGRSMPTFQFAAIVFFLGWLSITIFKKCRGKTVLADWRQPFRAYVLVLTGVCGYSLFLLLAFKSAPAFGVNILNYLWPVLIVLFTCYFSRSKIKSHQTIGVLCGFCGTALIFLPQLLKQPSSDLYPGYALAIIAAIIWAFYSVKAKNYNYPAAFIAPVMLIFALVSAALHFIFEQTIWPEVEIWLVIFTAGLTRFSYVLWDYGVRHGNAAALSSLAYFTPLFSTLLFLTFGFMPPASNIGLAAIFIILGSLIANAEPLVKMFSKRKRPLP